MVRIAGLMSSVLSRPLRVRVTGSVGAREGPVDRRLRGRRRRRSVVGIRRRSRGTRRASPTPGAPEHGRRAAPRRSRRCPRAARPRAARAAARGRSARASSKSRYSASLSWPTDRASPKLTLGRGEKPSVNASGSCSMRNARSKARATSRCETNRTLPRLVNREPDREALGRPSSGRAPERDRDHGRPKSMPWPVPWLPPAGGTAEATTCSRAYPVHTPQS